MTIATPEFAIVRPRIIGARTGESLLLEDVVEQVLEECGSGYLQITAGPGGGKTTAIAHLGAVFAHDERVTCLDEPTTYELEAAGDKLVVFSTVARNKRVLQLLLEPWGMDELIEYALARHHDVCNSILERLGPSARHRWAPGIASIVLDRFAADPTLAFPIDALMQHIDEGFVNASQRRAAAEYCLALLIGRGKLIVPALAELKRVHMLPSVVKLLRHEIVQLPLATEQICCAIVAKRTEILEHVLPRKLVRAMGRKCTTTAELGTRLSDLLNRRVEKTHAMAASILLAADPTWRPPRRRRTPWQFADGIFADAPWAGVDLTKASLIACDFSDANLVGAALNGACIDDAHFEWADLSQASLRVSGRRAHFAGAVLANANLTMAKLSDSDFSEANLSNARIDCADLTAANLSMANLHQASLIGTGLVGANLEDADLTEANLHDANLTRVDLRHATLDRVCFDYAMLKEAQLEDVRIAGAKLRKAKLFDAYLTGSQLPNADMRGADLRGAKLADIDWEGADLRGANLQGSTFHMGSSRSGLVNSPYACEGSKTGFYTDDLEDLNFKRPEEVRKANLRGADLRNVKAEGVDFYLVDLREAKLDARLRDQAAQTGAILDDFET